MSFYTLTGLLSALFALIALEGLLLYARRLRREGRRLEERTKQLDAELREMRLKNELERAQRSLSFFSENYESVYLLDYERDDFTTVSRSEYLSRNYSPEGSYLASFKAYCDKDVYPEDRERIFAAAQMENIARRLEEGKFFEERYRDLSTGVPRWWVMRVNRYPGMGKMAVLAFADCDADIRRDEERTFHLKMAAANFSAMEKALRTLQDEKSLDDLRPFLDIVRERFQADNCCLVRVDEERKTAFVDRRYDIGCENPETDHDWTLDLTLFEDEWRQLCEKGSLEFDIENSRRLWRAFGVPECDINEFGIGIISIVPVFVGGKRWGAINVGYSSDRHLHAGEFSHLRRLAEVLGSAIERQRSHVELLRALDEAKSAERMKSTFLATMSHEIRTPLNAVIGFAEFLRDGDGTEKERASYVGGIIKSSNALLALINDILDLSKLEAGRMTMRGGECNLVMLFDEMSSMFRFSTIEKGVKLKYAIAPDFPTLSLQEERVRQVMLNLIGNAVKFTPQGEICYSAEYTDGTLVIAVRDTGIGISESKFSSIFDPFDQDGGIRGGKVYAGTGLGLPICRHLVESAGGTISVESKVNGGTVFTVAIPGVEVVAGAGSSDGPEATVGVAPTAQVESGALPHRIYLVDDVPMNLTILSKHVQKHGVGKECIRDFLSAREALAAMREDAAAGVRPERAVVFTDMWMPKMNGEALARAIRTDPLLCKMKIVAVTADADSSSSFNVSLFDHFLTKPLTGDKVSGLFKEL